MKARNKTKATGIVYDLTIRGVATTFHRGSCQGRRQLMHQLFQI